MTEPIALGDRPRRVRDLLPALVHRLPVGVGVVRPDRSLAFANEALARMLRLPAAPDRSPAAPDGSQATWDPLSADDNSAYRRAMEPVDRALKDGHVTTRHPVSIGRADGTLDDLYVTTLPVSDGKGEFVSVIVYLEGPLEPREESSMREAYVDTLSHELRTPITAIYGGTQLLRDSDLAPDSRDAVLTDIAEGAEQLHLLVEDLLALARVERNVLTVSLEPVHVQRLAARAVAHAQRRWPDRAIVLQRALDLPAAAGDDGLVAQILRNLIANAVATSPVDSPVDVVIESTPTDVRVTIGDRGAGFASGIGDDAFRLYHRSQPTAAHRPDTGLALFVARALVEAQDGRIWQQDRSGGGAEVGLSLPRYVELPDG